jgi:dTDP-glucose 4,6-dehydratase
MGSRHIVITGGAGFIGSHLCDACLARGDRVTAVDNLITGSLDNIAHLEGRDDFTFVNRDISDGFGITGPVDVVLHFASPASPLGYLKYPIQTMKVGGVGTHNALGLARAKEAKYLFASTSEVYGDPVMTPQPETYWGNVNPVGPRGVYDEAKRFGEALSTAYRNVHGLDTQIVRLFNTYGPRMDIDDGRALPAFVKAALANDPLVIFGDGTQTRSFCYVSDTVRGILTLLDGGDGTPVNVGRPGELSILEFAKMIIEIVGSKSEIVFEAPMEDDPQRREPVIDKARALGWEPEVDLQEGLERTIAWFRERVEAGTSARG